MGTLSTGSSKLGGWFAALNDRRRNKKTMKSSKSLTLGESSRRLLVAHEKMSGDYGGFLVVNGEILTPGRNSW